VSVAARLFDLRPGEARLLAPALALGVLAVGAAGLAGLASDSLFIAAFSLGQVSSFYAVTALLRVAVALAYAGVAERASGPRLDVAALVAGAATMVVTGIVARRSSGAPLYVACAAQAAVSPLLPLVAMNAAMGCFHSRQAKRLLPLVAASASVGTIAVSAGASLLAASVGTPTLLFVAAGLALLALPFPALIRARAGVDDDVVEPTVRAPGAWRAVASTLSELRRVPVVRVVILSTLVASAASVLADYAFKAALKARYDVDAITSFMGTFGVAANAAVLVAQLFLTSRFVARFGVSTALRSLPVALVGLGPILALAPGVAASTALKFTETWLRFALGASVGDVLLTAAKPAVRTRAKLTTKAFATPLAALGMGAVLAAFGAAGPPSWLVGAMLVLLGVLGLTFLGDVRRAYATALSSTLGDGPLSLDIAPSSVPVLRAEIARLLAEAVNADDPSRALGVLALMGDRIFALSDLVPALSAPRLEVRRAALALAIKIGDGPERLLALVPPDEDPDIERALLAAARRQGASPSPERVDAAIARGGDGASPAEARLWAEALACRYACDRDASLKLLRKAARGGDGPLQAAAVAVIGELGDRRAEADVLLALGSSSPAVFAEAALSAVKLRAMGAVPTLIAHLTRGPHVRAAARALEQGGEPAVQGLLAALPITRGAGGIATAVAEHHEVAGTIRSARVLARIGPSARTKLLERYGDLGYRARNAVTRALADEPATPVDRALVEGAMAITIEYAEGLLDARPTAGTGLCRSELEWRLAETGARVLDLAAAITDRALVARVRVALARTERDRGKALELLENVLPAAIAVRTVAVLEGQPRTTLLPSRRAPDLDGWLQKCRAFDRGELSSTDPMLGVLERLLVLREASLFTALSSEELYPVGEIAMTVVFDRDSVVVREGDPGDALFVVESGAFSVLRDGKSVRRIEGRGAVFGEMALLDGAPRAATVVAETDARALKIPRAEFEALLDESPEIARGVIRTLLGHLRARGA
jgi:hypothetical protein